jgi:hypothetical protein
MGRHENASPFFFALSFFRTFNKAAYHYGKFGLLNLYFCIILSGRFSVCCKKAFLNNDVFCIKSV